MDCSVASLLGMTISRTSVSVSFMRLRIAHSTTYRYEPAATGITQILRMTPRQP